MQQHTQLNRRELLGGLATAGAANIVGPTAHADEPSANRVAAENARPGTRDWMLSNPRIEPKSRYRCPWVEGYCSHRSICAGETLTFHVSTNPPSPVKLEIFRTGYYGGMGGRKLFETEFLCETQLDPEIGEKRLRACDWPAAYRLPIAEDWLSGVYLGKLTATASGVQSYVIFIVRDNRPADFIFQCSDNTWQAYNRWPNQYSLYDFGKHEWFWGGGVLVGFNRPYGKYCQLLDAPLSTGSGEWLLWEFPLAYWLEEHGYDVTYISNHDTHNDPAGLRRAKGFLSVGHDEYWTIEMFENVRAGIAEGLNVAFFSGNAVFGRVRFDATSQAFERVGVFGPPGGTQEFEEMKSLEHVRPYGNELMGAHSCGPVTGGADWTCQKPDHWVFAGTGMKAGDSIPGLVGWEFHGEPTEIAGLEVLASGPTFAAPGQPNGGNFTATIYPGPKGNFVFNAATIWWADAISEPPGYIRPKAYLQPAGPNRNAQIITGNLLAKMAGVPRQNQ